MKLRNNEIIIKKKLIILIKRLILIRVGSEFWNMLIIKWKIYNKLYKMSKKLLINCNQIMVF